ncbi:hypothetical protein M0222_29020 [Myxococcus fulvus]|nr:hypothetical protein [Myxococcus fulvus]
MDHTKCATPSGITASGAFLSSHNVAKAEISECSTPSGITASGSGVGRLLRQRRVVLNAFRHHGEQRAATDPRGLPCRGAQRLPASRRAAVRDFLLDHPSRIVLYALCHHVEQLLDGGIGGFAGTNTYSTPSGITASSGGALFGLFGKRKKCSTPSGITAIGSHEPEVRRVPLGVLNAFHHHGEQRPGPRG